MSEFELFLSQLKTKDLFEGQANGKPYIFDFTENNQELKSIDLNEKNQFEGYINSKIDQTDFNYGIGRYAENRTLYRRFGLFENEDSRSFHLGLDIWMKAGTSISAPLDGILHSFNDNNNPGDYGPTIILKHDIEGHTFHTLYGHLSRESLNSLCVGKKIKAGSSFCSLGKWDENVFWPPHLHFQVIKDMGSFEGDYPGVCKFNEREKWMDNCPDPNSILRINLD